ncbi:hypothetical protein F5148DRAFT_1186893 [Russula earlei]|uniref:Uncharacterized protein n=1 Tax=Russula earlei TaxID=71964 RepID=A0ACC0UCQ4_9AGAM|nr:hypothetical protein F5148DRAFT_1186893 [Russula earlei]
MSHLLVCIKPLNLWLAQPWGPAPRVVAACSLVLPARCGSGLIIRRSGIRANLEGSHLGGVRIVSATECNCFMNSSSRCLEDMSCSFLRRNVNFRGETELEEVGIRCGTCERWNDATSEAKHGRNKRGAHLYLCVGM